MIAGLDGLRFDHWQAERRPDGVLVLSLMYNGRRTGAARAAQWELFRLLGAEGADLRGALETHMGGLSVPRDSESGEPLAGGR